MEKNVTIFHPAPTQSVTFLKQFPAMLLRNLWGSQMMTVHKKEFLGGGAESKLHHMNVMCLQNEWGGRWKGGVGQMLAENKSKLDLWLKSLIRPFKEIIKKGKPPHKRCGMMIALRDIKSHRSEENLLRLQFTFSDSFVVVVAAKGELFFKHDPKAPFSFKLKFDPNIIT